MPGVATGARQIHKAVIERWFSAGLDALVRSKRANPAAPYDTLHDSEAPPRPVFPYVIFTQQPGPPPKHQSHSDDAARETRAVVWTFHVYAAEAADSAKVTAGAIAEAIEAAFHNKGQEMCLDTGAIIGMELQGDFASPRDDDDIYLWVCEYLIRYDAKVNP